MANPLYKRDFKYVSCDIPGRDELIKDEDDDDEKYCEQSDLSSVLLNKACIPQMVMVQLRFKSGFNKTFKPLIDGYFERRGPSSQGNEELGTQ